MKYKLSILLLCATGSVVCMDAKHPPLDRSLTPRTAFFMKIMTTENMAPDVQATLNDLARESLENAVHQSSSNVRTLLAVRQCVKQGYRDFALLSDQVKNFALTDVVRIALADKKKRIDEGIKAWADKNKTSPDLYLDSNLLDLLKFLEDREPIEALEQERAKLDLSDDESSSN